MRMIAQFCPSHAMPRLCGLILSALLGASGPALALSDIPEQALPDTQSEIQRQTLPDITPVPVLPGDEDNAAGDAPDVQGSETPTSPAAPNPVASEEPAVEVQYDLSALPRPVARMRELILEAVATGDIENLRSLAGTGETATSFVIDQRSDDPIAALKAMSGDDDGHEILAILAEILNAGYVHTNRGTDRELYVWPYFYAVELKDLTPQQRVELFKIITAGDYEEMVDYGSYLFYRTGITPDGEWTFFLAGD